MSAGVVTFGIWCQSLCGFWQLPLHNGLVAHLQQVTTRAIAPVFEIGNSVRIAGGGFAGLNAMFIAMGSEQPLISLYLDA